MISKLVILLLALFSWYTIRESDVSTRVNLLAALMFMLVFYQLLEEKK